MTQSVKNANQLPKTYYCRHMQPGTARYENETILVDTDGMKNMINSIGTKSIPVYVFHQDVDVKNIQMQADGYVTESFYNSLDGWAWFKFLAVSDGSHEAIKKNWRVSNAYVPTEMGPKGTKNNVPYNREFRNGEFTHLAIVPDPRYEGALIYTPDEFKNYQDDLRKKIELKNSKGKNPMLKFKFWNKVETETPNDDTLVDVGDGKLVPWGEVKNSLEEHDKQEKSVVMINGKEMTLAEAAAKFAEIENAKKKKNAKKNGESKMKEDPEEEEVDGDEDTETDDEIGEGKRNGGKKAKAKKNEKEEKDCMNSDDDDDKEEEMDNKKEKKNSKIDIDKDDSYFKEMRNAHLKQDASVPMISSSIDQLERGKQRYGSAKK